MDTIDARVADPLEGELLGGRYRIVGRLARAGRASGATVYQAHDELLERGVSIKIANPDHVGDPEVSRRLTDEAETAARLSHPNTVAVFDRGRHRDAPFLVMEFVRGRSLREVLAERRRLDPAESLAILEQLLAALTVAHRAGLVHREVTPENILVIPPPNGSGDLVDAVVKVADFGLSRAVEVSRAAAPHGELDYVAPEVLAEGRADARADVYSTGVVLYEMLTGRVPPTGEAVPPPSRIAHGVPQLLDDLVTRATRTDPSGRPRDAAAMLSEIQSAREDVGALAGPTRAIAPPTVVVPSLGSDARPAWARLHTLPASPAIRVRRALGSLVDRGLALTHGLRSTRQGRRALVASVIVIGLLLVTGGWWLGFGRYTETPTLTQLTRDNAVAEAARLGFSVEFAAGRYAEDVPIDTVMEQRPPAGERIVSGGIVTLVLSLGPERYPVPNVAGQHADVATSRLKEHFVVSTRDGYSDTLPAGYVVATDPPVGTALAPNSEVTLIIARAPFPVHIPSVVGRLRSEAESQLRGLGFSDIEVQYREDATRPRNTVLEQTPPAGQGLETAAGVKITLILAEGAKVQMPSVMGVRCGDAKNQLAALGLQVQVDGNAIQQVTGSVDQQVPAAGSPLDEGQTVEIRCR